MDINLIGILWLAAVAAGLYWMFRKPRSPRVGSTTNRGHRR